MFVIFNYCTQNFINAYFISIILTKKFHYF